MTDSPKEGIPDQDDTTEAPLTMAASVVLTHLPKDASKALETAGNLTVEKSTSLSMQTPNSRVFTMMGCFGGDLEHETKFTVKRTLS